MKAEDKIKTLKKEIELLKRQQSNCNHEFGEPEYDAEEISVQDDRLGYETHGADRWPALSFHKENKDRWSRECSECGKKEYTYQLEVVSIKKQPKF